MIRSTRSTTRRRWPDDRQLPKSSMESTRSRSLKRPVSLTMDTTASGMGEGDDEVPSSREDGWKSNPKESEVPWTPCDEEAYKCSISTDDDDFSGLRVFPEERTTTKPKPLWISDTSPTATSSIGCSVDLVANNHFRAKPSVSTTNQPSCGGLSDSTPPGKSRPSSESHSLSQISKSPPSSCGNASSPRPGSSIRLSLIRPLLRTAWGA
jgi:hypothetical protein